MKMATEEEIATEAGNIFGMEDGTEAVGNKARPGSTDSVGEASQKSVVESDKVMPAVKVTDLAEVAKDIKCDESSALSVLKSYIKNGVKEDNRIEAMIDADTKIIFRKDFGEKHAHGLESFGYPPGEKIDHYNIEIQSRSKPGTLIDRWDKIKVFHIVIEENGKINFF